jgi:succinate dehydrogenase / fumarate reductase, membrane anchor subunit
VGADYAAALDYVGGPLVVVPSLLLVLSGTWHVRVGMQAIFKDCVHDNLLQVLVLALNNFFPQQLQSVLRMRC